MPSQLQHIHPVVSISLVKPFKRRLGDVLPPVSIDGALEYEVEDIVDYNILTSRRRNVPSVVEFRVRWKGACDDSWHEPQDFEHSQDTLVSFLQKLTKSQRIKVLKTFIQSPYPGYRSLSDHYLVRNLQVPSPPSSGSSLLETSDDDEEVFSDRNTRQKI
jgi:hypothetical protein